MRSSADPIGDLVLLCRAAAEAGEHWRGRLATEWLPRLLAERTPAELATAMRDFSQDPEAEASAAAIEQAVVETMAEDGYV